MRRSWKELAPPAIAKKTTAMEILRVWTHPGAPQEIVLKTMWEDPGAWGLMLADVARHAAKAYTSQGWSEAEALERIKQFYQDELTAPSVVEINTYNSSSLQKTRRLSKGQSST